MNTNLFRKSLVSAGSSTQQHGQLMRRIVSAAVLIMAGAMGAEVAKAQGTSDGVSIEFLGPNGNEPGVNSAYCVYSVLFDDGVSRLVFVPVDNLTYQCPSGDDLKRVVVGPVISTVTLFGGHTGPDCGDIDFDDGADRSSWRWCRLILANNSPSGTLHGEGLVENRTTLGKAATSGDITFYGDITFDKCFANTQFDTGTALALPRHRSRLRHHAGRHHAFRGSRRCSYSRHRPRRGCRCAVRQERLAVDQDRLAERRSAGEWGLDVRLLGGGLRRRERRDHVCLLVGALKRPRCLQARRQLAAGLAVVDRREPTVRSAFNLGASVVRTQPRCRGPDLQRVLPRSARRDTEDARVSSQRNFVVLYV